MPTNRFEEAAETLEATQLEELSGEEQAEAIKRAIGSMTGMIDGLDRKKATNMFAKFEAGKERIGQVLWEGLSGMKDARRVVVDSTRIKEVPEKQREKYDEALAQAKALLRRRDSARAAKPEVFDAIIKAEVTDKLYGEEGLYHGHFLSRSSETLGYQKAIATSQDIANMIATLEQDLPNITPLTMSRRSSDPDIAGNYGRESREVDFHEMAVKDLEGLKRLYAEKLVEENVLRGE